MKELNIDSRLYRNIVPQVIDLLLRKNDITTMFSDAELSPYEQAMVNRVFGKQLCEIITVEGNVGPLEAVKVVEHAFEFGSRVVMDRLDNRKKKFYKRGLTSFTLMENISDTNGLSTKNLSGKVMKNLEKWGYVESYREKQSLKLYKITGYKKDFLKTSLISRY